MRHLKSGRKLSRTSSHRKAMFANMVTSLFEHGRIQTTDAKAKELRRVAERLITVAKRGAAAEAEAGQAVDDHAKQRLVAKGLHARRRAARIVRDKAVLATLFSDIQERFQERPGGYTRIVKLGNRYGDAAPISLIELVGNEPKIADVEIDDDDDEAAEE